MKMKYDLAQFYHCIRQYAALKHAINVKLPCNSQKKNSFVMHAFKTRESFGSVTRIKHETSNHFSIVMCLHVIMRKKS